MRIAIIGCGNMGLTYTRSFLHYNILPKQDLILIEKNESRQLVLQQQNLGVVHASFDKELIASCDILILAIKPQDYPTLASDLKDNLSPNNLVLSIMAGITIDRLETSLKHKNIIRAMPNTPALVGMGATVFTAKENIPIDKVRIAENLLSTTGRTFFFEDEKLLDAVTALSGSGPAYFFYFVKQMIEAGKKMGIDEASAAMLVKQTMLGSFHLMNNADRTLDELMNSVKSKGGTTEAAFNSFDNNKLADHIQNGIFSAEARAKELSKST